MLNIRIADIKMGSNRRPIKQEAVAQLADSINAIGLINPITLDMDNNLIAGAHRIEAFKLLGREAIPAMFKSLYGLEAELAEIDENLMRNELHFTDRGDQLLRRKVIYEELHPETKAGASQARGMNEAIGNDVSEIISPTFTDDTSAKLNVSKRTVEQDIQIAKNLTPEAKEAVRVADIPKTDALKLARMEPQKQNEIALKLSQGVAATVIDAERAEKAKRKLERIEAMKSNAKHDDNFIFGDCLEEMVNIKGRVSCVITDPPYGIDYISNYRVIDNSVDRAIRNDEKEFAFKLWDATCSILFGKMDDNAHLYCFTSWKVFAEFKEITEKYFYVRNCLIWEKNNWSMGDLDGNYAEQYEMIIFATKGNKKLNGRRDTNVLHFDRVANSALLHSCEKPIPLIEFLLDKSTVEGDLVVDPFAGSGAILKACKNKSRNYWGCECDKDNYGIALGRLSDGDKR